MNKQPTTCNPSALPRLFRATLIAGILPAIFLLSTPTTQAGSATWKTSPATGDWNNPNNWTPATVPNSPTDTATFQSSNVTSLSLSDFTETDGIVFNAGASAFTISSKFFVLTISGAGVTNNSGIMQNFLADSTEFGAGEISFNNSATAGNSTSFTIAGVMEFRNSSSADHGTFINNGGEFESSSGGVLFFENSSTASNGTFTNNGGAASNATGGSISFPDASTAGSGALPTTGGLLATPAGALLL